LQGSFRQGSSHSVQPWCSAEAYVVVAAAHASIGVALGVVINRVGGAHQARDADVAVITNVVAEVLLLTGVAAGNTRLRVDAVDPAIAVAGTLADVRAAVLGILALGCRAP